MTLYYSAATRGFYASDVHGLKEAPGSLVPEDAIEISEARHSELLEAQTSGKVIEPDAEGRPVAVTPPPHVPTLDEVKARARALIAATDWSQLADVDEETRSEFAAYRGLLRGIISQATDPAAVIWPDKPETN